MSTTIDFAALKAPFPPEEVEWRLGSTNKDKTKGLALAYITSRHVMDRLDTVVGPANWQDRYEIFGPRCICYLSIRIDGEWITKADGAGDTQVEAEKGGLSDALKRAAVQWGIGRYLYELGNVWVDCTPRGNSAVMAKGQEERLIGALRNLAQSRNLAPPQTEQPAPDWATERDELARMVNNCSSIEDLGELWRTARFQNFLRNAPQEFSSPVIRIKERWKKTADQLERKAA